MTVSMVEDLDDWTTSWEDRSRMGSRSLCYDGEPALLFASTPTPPDTPASRDIRPNAADMNDLERAKESCPEMLAAGSWVYVPRPHPDPYARFRPGFDPSSDPEMLGADVSDTYPVRRTRRCGQSQCEIHWWTWDPSRRTE